AVPGTVRLVRWYARLLQMQRIRCLRSKPEATNSADSALSSAGCDAGLPASKLSTGLTSPRPKKWPHIRLTVASAKNLLVGEVSQPASAGRKGAVVSRGSSPPGNLAVTTLPLDSGISMVAPAPTTFLTAFAFFPDPPAPNSPSSKGSPRRPGFPPPVSYT